MSLGDTPGAKDGLQRVTAERAGPLEMSEAVTVHGQRETTGGGGGTLTGGAVTGGST